MNQPQYSDYFGTTPARGITYGPEIIPVWHALTVAPNKERATKEMLKLKDVFAFYPEKEITYHQRGKSFKRKLPVITRIVYARFTQAPQFDVMRRRGLITGVYSYGDRPIVIPVDIIRQIQGLPTEAERLAAARLEMLRIREGDRATITTGPLSGFMVNISDVAEGRAWFDTLTGIKGEMPVDGLERVT